MFSYYRVHSYGNCSLVELFLKEDTTLFLSVHNHLSGVHVRRNIGISHDVYVLIASFIGIFLFCQVEYI
jgi:hypothetical protein